MLFKKKCDIVSFLIIFYLKYCIEESFYSAHTYSTATIIQASWGLCQLVRELSVNCWRCLWLAEASVHHHCLCMSVCFDKHPLEQECYQSESSHWRCVRLSYHLCPCAWVGVSLPAEGLIGLACS